MVGNSSSSSDHDEQKEVVFMATPAMGMLPPTVEFARRLIHRSNGLISGTFLLVPVPQWPAINTYTQSLLATSSSNLHFHLLPPLHPPPPDRHRTYVAHVSSLVDAYKPAVKTAVSEIITTTTQHHRRRVVVGMFVDMFCSGVADVADELGVCSYVFFASPAGFLSFVLEAPSVDLNAEMISVRGYENPVPNRLLPASMLSRGDGFFRFLEHGKRYAATKGIVVNTSRELEPFALDSLSVPGSPEIFPVGPILSPSLGDYGDRDGELVMKWLDGQPECSVVFLCFGSLGSFGTEQVREIATGLKRAGVRFLWSCRDRPKEGAITGVPSEYASFDGVLPEGFLDETCGTGLVCGWVPQVAVLAHSAVGGFVSHCGWNSVLESLWHGVPIAVWPVYAEQHMNAFQMVRELGLAVEIFSTEFRTGSDLVAAEEVERGIRRLMAEDEGVRAKVEDMRGKIRMAIMENGSSYQSMGALVDQLLAN